MDDWKNKAEHWKTRYDNRVTESRLIQAENAKLKKDIQHWAAYIEELRLGILSLETQLDEQRKWKDEALAALAKHRWIPIGFDTPDIDAEVLCIIEHLHTKGRKRVVLCFVDEDDNNWRTTDDNTELSHDWDVILWQEIILPE